jgi:hypothetical protein
MKVSRMPAMQPLSSWGRSSGGADLLPHRGIAVDFGGVIHPPSHEVDAVIEDLLVSG